MISQAGPYLCITVLGRLVLNRKEINVMACSSINKNGSEKENASDEETLVIGVQL